MAFLGAVGAPATAGIGGISLAVGREKSYSDWEPVWYNLPHWLDLWVAAGCWVGCLAGDIGKDV